MVLGKIKVDDPCPACPAPALQGHPYLAQALQTRDDVAFLRVFQQVVLKLVEIGVIGDLQDEAGEQRQLDEGQFRLTLTL